MGVPVGTVYLILSSLKSRLPAAAVALLRPFLHSSRPPSLIKVRPIFQYLAVFESQDRAERRLPCIALVGIEERCFNYHNVPGGVGVLETNLALWGCLEDPPLQLSKRRMPFDFRPA